MKTATVPRQIRSLKRRIVAVRVKRSIVKTATGIAIALAALIGLLLGEMLLDVLVDLPWLARAVVLLGTLGGSGFLLWREAIHPLRQRLNDDAIASMIEHALPAFRTRFIASLQLARAAGRETPPALVRALLAETTAMAATQDFRQVIKTTKLRRAMTIAVSVIALASLLAWAGGPSSMILLERALLFTIALPHKTHILTVTGDRKIGLGEDLKIDVTAAGILPATGQVIATTVSGLTRQFILDRDPALRGKYSAVIHSPQESFTYYVRLFDDTSPKYNVLTIGRPAVLNVTTLQTYPDYVNLPPVNREPGDLSLLVGSSLKVTVKASTLISKGWLHLTGLEKDLLLDVNPRDLTTLTGEFKIPAKNLTGFSIHLVDTHSVASGEGATYRIDPVLDQPPTVQITFPTQQEELATPQATEKLSFEGNDDYGIVKAVLHYSIDGGPTKNIEFDLGGSTEKKLPRSFVWKLAEVVPHLAIGNSLEYWVTVTDANTVTGPGVGESDHYAFKIVSEKEKTADMQNRLNDFMGAFTDLTNNQKDAAEELGSPLFVKPKY
jgi:hypothetical protein